MEAAGAAQSAARFAQTCTDIDALFLWVRRSTCAGQIFPLGCNADSALAALSSWTAGAPCALVLVFYPAEATSLDNIVQPRPCSSVRHSVPFESDFQALLSVIVQTGTCKCGPQAAEYRTAGDLSATEACLQRIAELAPREARAYFALGQTYALQQAHHSLGAAFACNQHLVLSVCTAITVLLCLSAFMCQTIQISTPH